jgi:nitrogen-specific signal transduction histidine kinase/CheY-like chemotaxis protein
MNSEPHSEAGDFSPGIGASGSPGRLQLHLADKLRRSQRMESFGLLAAGITHDINNVLACVMGGAELLDATLENASDQTRRVLGQILNASERGASMTRKILSMARLEEGVPAPVKLSSVIQDVAGLMERSLEPGVSIQLDLPEQDLAVRGDTTSLHQIMLNLLLNAREALKGKGEIRITLEPGSMGELRSRIQSSAGTVWEVLPAYRLDDESPVMHLQIADSGCGMSSGLMHDVFDPFVSTKDPGKGTGLGLHMVRELVQQADGWLACASREGQGTAFSVAFPLYDGQAAAMPSAATESVSLEMGAGRILVVEDDPNVRRTMVEILQFLGYTTDSAVDGLEAMEMYQQSPAAWDLVLMDLKMPRMDGVETLRRMFMLNAAQRVLVSTGYANSDLVSQLEGLGEIPLISKPVRMTQLSQELKRLMN